MKTPTRPFHYNCSVTRGKISSAPSTRWAFGAGDVLGTVQKGRLSTRAVPDVLSSIQTGRHLLINCFAFTSTRARVCESVCVCVCQLPIAPRWA